MFLHQSKLIRVFAAAVAVSSCNGANFNSDKIPTKQAPKAADVEKEPEPAPVETPVPTPEPTPDVDLPDTELPIPEKVPVIKKEVITVEETFTQEGLAGSADIALVIDDSGSMDLEQNNLSTKLNDLLVALKDANWQIGVVTTTAKQENGKDVCHLKLIKSTDADAETRFKDAVTPGITGSGQEQGIRQAVNALRCPETPWVRPDSTIAVLIVSDEDNCSKDGLDCGKEPWAKEDYLINYVEQDLQRVVGQTAGFYGIIAPANEKCDSANNKGVQYERLFNYKSTMGNLSYGNICDLSYKSTLERISQNIAKLLESKFTLKQMPDIGSSVITGVKANGDLILAEDYSINGNTVTFKIGSEPALGSQIVLTYKVTKITIE